MTCSTQLPGQRLLHESFLFDKRLHMGRAALLLLALPTVVSMVGARPARSQQVAVMAPPELDSLRPHIRHLLDSTHAPSLTVAVAHHGKIVWEEGFGSADLAHHLPATPNTLASSGPVRTTRRIRSDCPGPGRAGSLARPTGSDCRIEIAARTNTTPTAVAQGTVRESRCTEPNLRRPPADREA